MLKQAWRGGSQSTARPEDCSQFPAPHGGSNISNSSSRGPGTLFPLPWVYGAQTCKAHTGRDYDTFKVKDKSEYKK